MDGETLAGQLAQLGRQLDEATEELARLDILATGKGITAAKLKEDHEDALAEAFRDATGSVEVRKAEARLQCSVARKVAQQAAADWEMAKSDVRNQQQMIRALTTRIEVGRSLLSRERALIGLV